ncbi:diguanylate cyclase [Eggerthella sp. HF-4214]|uniref:Diguanylate cyclase n=2 Tax=Eggerthella guodeyinii TaxID=2690837 RepID=A0A6N7RLZ2_9ACTN|nr:diguanylate cyclase [Eggerthella guodeyinii]
MLQFDTLPRLFPHGTGYTRGSYDTSGTRRSCVITRALHPAFLHACARALLSALVACALFPGIALAQDSSTEAPHRTVTVGYMDSAGILTKKSDGTYEGYTYDYLMRVAQFTGWTFEFVEAQGETSSEQAADLMDMIDSARVDVIGGMTYSPALGERYEYPQNSYGSAHTSLFAPNVGATVSRTNLFTQDELHVAIVSTAKQRRAELEYYCEQNGIKLVTIECDTIEEMHEKTLAGEADVFLEIDINIQDGFHIVSSFAERPYFFASPAGDRAIIDEIDATIVRINQGNPQLQETLYNKYFMKSETNFALTDQELQYARNHETLRVGVIAEKAPLQSFDKQTGEFKGVTQGVLEYLSEHAGLSFEVVKIPRSDDIDAAIREANVDIVAGVNDNDSTSADHSLALTAPYMSTSTLLVYNKFVDPDDLEGKTIALPWELGEAAPEGADVRLYDTLEECFEAVNSGKADYTYGQSYTTPYYLNIDNLNNLLYLPTSTKTVDICFGIVQPIDPDLLVIFNKSLRDLSGTDLDSIIYDNSLIDQSEQINSFISDHLLEFALGCISLLLIIIVLLMLYLRSRMSAARAVREENLRFQELYRLANEQFFEYSIKTDTLRISKSKSVLADFADEGDMGMEDDSSYLAFTNARERIKENGNPELLEAFTSPTHSVTEVLCNTGTHPDSARQWLRITSHFVEDDDGKPISVIGKIANIDEEMREKMDLSERAHHDGLTGLLNWKTFQEKAGALLVTGKAGALLVVDTDDFKSVNDTYGHLAGDRALQQAAAALAQAFRPQDLVGRLGGDEFAICIDGEIDYDRLAQACAAIVGDGVSFSDQQGDPHAVTLSIGGVELHGKADSYQSAYRQADKALYRAKTDGKNRYVIEHYRAE